MYNSHDDYSMAFAIGWNPRAVFVGVKVYDDTHQNAGSGWNGDSVQIAFTNPARNQADDAVLLYNYGLADHLDLNVLHHEEHPCPLDDSCTEAAMQRFETQHITAYEIKFEANSIGIDTITTGAQFGFGMVANDGDTMEGTAGIGQKGWAGWGPYAVVFGKNSASAGLVTLSGTYAPNPHRRCLATWVPRAPLDYPERHGVEAADLHYRAQQTDITLDANLDDWKCLPVLAQTPFRSGNEDQHAAWTEFQEYSGGHWKGLDDHALAFAMAWSTSAVFIGAKVIDDTHQNAGSGWNGDSLQIATTNAARDAVPQVYNYGMADEFIAAGPHHITAGNCGGNENSCTEAVIDRIEGTRTTIYEIKLTAEQLGMDSITMGSEFGFGICSNDGDSAVTGEANQGGQKGWSGWGPYAIVYGNNPESAGLVTLVRSKGGTGYTPSGGGHRLLEDDAFSRH